jgi:hypothetical protein
MREYDKVFAAKGSPLTPADTYAIVTSLLAAKK